MTAEVEPDRVRGGRVTDDWEEIGTLMDENAWSPDLTGVRERRLSVVGYEMGIEEATGLQRRPLEDAE